jgi:hypothetical protein
MAQQRAERERVKRRMASQPWTNADFEAALTPPQQARAGMLQALRASFSHSMATLLRYTWVRAGTTHA